MYRYTLTPRGRDYLDGRVTAAELALAMQRQRALAAALRAELQAELDRVNGTTTEVA